MVLRFLTARLRGLFSCLLFSLCFLASSTAHAQNPLARFAASGSTLPASENIGATAAEFGVSPSGVASYSIPIAVPIGTTGVQPKLALNLSTPGGSGPFGYGSSISGLSFISRCGTDLYNDQSVHAVDFTAADKFCLNGQRLVAVSGTYGANGTEYRTSPEEFSKIISYGSAGTGPERFVVFKKSGEILEYGNTADSRLEAIGKPEARVWALNKLSDRSGNYLKFTYFEELNGDFGPSSVAYTGNDAQGLAPYNRVDFIYETALRSSITYSNGKPYTTGKRLTNVKVYADSTLFRDYRLTFQSPSQLQKIEECTETVCLRPTTFTWSAAEDTTPTGGYLTAKLLDTSGIMGAADDDLTVVADGDFNGDGLQDLYLMEMVNDGSRRVDGGSDYIFQGKSDGTFQRITVAKPTITGSSTYTIISAGDFNGDGRTDLAISYVPSGSFFQSGRALLYSKPDGTFDVSAVQVPPAQCSQPVCSVYNGVGRSSNAISDFNGDGLGDLYFVTTDDTGRFVSGVQDVVMLSNGSGGFSQVQQPSGAPVPANRKIVGSGDFNGDGLSDLLIFPTDQYGNYASVSNLGSIVWLATGDGHFTKVPFVSGTDPLPISNAVVVGSGDLNGDGLTDFYFANTHSGRFETSGSDHRVWLSTGDGHFKAVNPLITVGPVTNYENYTIAGSGDFNNDGWADFYVMDVDAYRRSEGSADVIWFSKGDGTFDPVRLNVADSVPEDHRVVGGGDFNGDGLPDLYHFKANTAGISNGTASDYVRLGNFKRPDLITAITNGLGNKIETVYKPLTDPAVYTKGTGAQYPVADVRPAVDLVAQVKTDNGIGGQNSQTYSYKAMRTHVKGAGSLGFEEMRINDDATGIYTISTYSQDYANKFQGTLTRSTTTTPGGVLLDDKRVSVDKRCFGTVGGPDYRCFVFSPDSTTYKRDLNGAELPTLYAGTTYDDYGSPTTTWEATGFNPATTLVTRKSTTMTYSHDPATWILGRMTQAQAVHRQENCNPACDMTRLSTFTYHATTGQLLTETIQPGDALTSTKTYSQNAFGAVTQLVETWGSPGTSGIAATSRTTQFTYDTRSRYRISETNPLGHAQTTVYDALHGLATSTTGPNGLTTTQTYSPFGLPLVETRADGNTTKGFRYWCDGDTLCPANGAYVEVVQAAGAPIKAVYKDKLNRTLRETAQGLDGRLIDVDTLYDSKGNVVQHSAPKFDGATALWTTIAYDLIGRPTLTTRPDAATQTVVYNGLVSTSTNELAQTKTITKNSLGQIIASRDHAANITTYEYDSIGQQTAIVDPAGNRTTSTYDIRGNKIGIVDPDRGTWTYRYNALGLLVDQTDAKSQMTSMTYDVLGRMLTRIDNATAANPATRTSTWLWDTQTKGVGKLASTSGYGYQATVTYDTLGRPISNAETIDGATYTVTTAYDALGRPSTMTYPTGLVASNGYNATGHLEKVSNATSGLIYWKANTADARGNITNSLFGNGVTDERFYNPNTGLLTGIASSTTTDTLRMLSYTWDQIGNLHNRTDTRVNLQEQFTYDNLNRVTQSQTTTGQDVITTTVTYDALGNITAKSDTGTYTYASSDACGTAGPHAVKAVSGSKTAAYCFDANGAMTSGDGRTVTWSAFGMPTRIEQGLRAIDFTYGPDRARFKRVDANETGGSTTHYAAGGAFEKVTTSTGQITQKLTIAGIAVVIDTATVPGNWQSETRYLLTDHLGSVDVVTGDTGNVVERLSFDAWGKRRKLDWTLYALGTSYAWQGNAITRGFTMHEQLDPVGLVHMNGRVYDPELGRFMSPDIVIQDVSNLQSINAYSYVLNNPLSLTDPTGYFFSGLFKAIGSFFKSVFRAIGNVFKAILNSQIGRAFIQLAACSFGPIACVAASAAITLATGGTIGDAVIAFAQSFVSFATWGITGAYLNPIVDSLSLGAGMALKGAVHGVIGGALSMAQGGDFSDGFAANAVGAGAGLLAGSGTFGKLGTPDGLFARTAIAATAGGLAAEITGGKFSNGAITAGMAHIFNAESQRWRAPNNAAWPGSPSNQKLANDTERFIGGLGDKILGNLILQMAAIGSMLPANGNSDGKIHNNSAASMEETELYYLIDRSTSEIAKIGITMYSGARYSQAELDGWNVIYAPQAVYSYRYPAMVDENIRLTFYRYEHGKLPRLNYVTR